MDDDMDRDMQRREAQYRLSFRNQPQERPYVRDLRLNDVTQYVKEEYKMTIPDSLYRCFGILKRKTENNQYCIGPAFAISPNMIMTASSNIKLTADQLIHSVIGFEGCQQKLRQYAIITNALFHRDFLQKDDLELDPLNYCILYLDKAVKWSSFVNLCLGFNKKEVLILAGYNKISNVILTRELILESDQKQRKILYYRFKDDHYDPSDDAIGGLIIRQDKQVVKAVGMSIGKKFAVLFTQKLISNIFCWMESIKKEQNIRQIKILNIKNQSCIQKIKQNILIRREEEQYEWKKEHFQYTQQTSHKQFIEGFSKNRYYQTYSGFQIGLKFRMDKADLQYIIVDGVHLYYSIKTTRQYNLQDLKGQFQELKGKKFRMPHYLKLESLIKDYSYPLGKRQRLQWDLNLINIREFDYNKIHMQRTTKQQMIKVTIQRRFQRNSFMYTADHQTTIDKILNYVKQRYGMGFDDYDEVIVKDSDAKIITKKNFIVKFKEQSIKENKQQRHVKNSLAIQLYSFKPCFFGPKTLVRLCQQGDLSFQDILKRQKATFLGCNFRNNKYDEDNFSVSCGNVNTKEIKWYYEVEYESDGVIFTLECTSNARFKLQPSYYSWGTLQMLQKGTTIYGLTSIPPYCLKQYKVVSVKQIISRWKIFFYSVSVDTHNFIGNNLILHNQDEFEIDVINIQTGHSYKQRFFKNKKIEEKFKYFDVKVAGMVLDPSSTYADYQLHKTKKLFICRKESDKKQDDQAQADNQQVNQENNLVLIDLAEKQPIKLQQLDNIDRQKYQQHYLGINGFRINSITSKKKMTKDNIESIVFNKVFLQRMQFLQRIDTQERPNQKEIYKLINKIICLDAQTVWKNSRVRQRLKEKIKGRTIQQIEQFSFQLPTKTKIQKKLASYFIKDFFMLKDLKLLTLFLTQQKLFQKINSKLETLPNFDTDSHLNKEFYELIGLIYQTITALPISHKIQTVYRRAQVHGDLFVDNIGQIIMFQGFTLTHAQIRKTVEQSNNGVIFQIETTSVRCVQKIFENQQKQDNYFILLPYTCFVVQKYEKTQDGTSIVKLVQIPLPSTNAKGIVLQMNDKQIDNRRLQSQTQKLQYHLRLQSAFKQNRYLKNQDQDQKYSAFFKQKQPSIRTEKQRRQISTIKLLLGLPTHHKQQAYELQIISYGSQQKETSHAYFNFNDQDTKINMYYSFQCLLDKLKSKGVEACIQDLQNTMEIQAFIRLQASIPNQYPYSVIQEKLDSLKEEKAIIQLRKGQKRNEYKMKNYVEVIPVLSDNIMHRILQNFYPIYKFLNKQVIVSLNTDKEMIKQDYEAYGYSIKTILDPKVWKYKTRHKGYPEDIRQKYAQHEQKLRQFVQSSIYQFKPKRQQVEQKRNEVKDKADLGQQSINRRQSDSQQDQSYESF